MVRWSRGSQLGRLGFSPFRILPRDAVHVSVLMAQTASQRSTTTPTLRVVHQRSVLVEIQIGKPPVGPQQWEKGASQPVWFSGVDVAVRDLLHESRICAEDPMVSLRGRTPALVLGTRSQRSA
ncbi:MAG: hypothetical protein BJ554DRAFT_3630 [Olpidium bornovanus]|uniref:Uncharacterized protein n=1 Tax=Olpidium bornovanus TaxID=278681 RepID=A0A8H8DG40_9FUNG|nr:MAG: hypothetical protein BJ554DRAFT_3630 [Olpidium bornovanus]